MTDNASHGGPHSRSQQIRQPLEAFDPGAKGPWGWRLCLYEFLLFRFKQGWVCLFGGSLVALVQPVRRPGKSSAPDAKAIAERPAHA